MALGAPLFTLVSSELYPNHLSTPFFILAWLLAALVLLGLFVFLVPPAVSTGSGSSSIALQAGAANGTAAGLAPPGSPLSPAGIAAASSSPLSVAAGAANGSGGAGGGNSWVSGQWWAAPARGGAGAGCFWQHCGARRPRRNVLLALLSSLQCLLWMSVAADELVALFQVGLGCRCTSCQLLLLQL